MGFVFRGVYTLAIIFILSSKSFSQTNGIYLKDSNTKNPISGVLLESSDSKVRRFSDENGFLGLEDLPKTNRSYRLNSFGYQKEFITLNSSGQLDKTNIIYLKPKPLSLSEVTIHASSSISHLKFLSDLDIQLKPVSNSQEILRTVPGLFIGQHAGGGKAEQIFLRGFDIDHGTDINISVDGIPVNMVSHAHGQGYADLHFLIPESIESVGFNKGPYYADKGNFTTAGYVEFKTKDFLDRDIVKIEAAQFKTIRGILGVNLIKKNSDSNLQSLYFMGEGSFSNGYFDHPQDFSRWNGLLKYKKKLSQDNTLRASISGFSSKWDASGQIPIRAVNDGTVGFYGAIDNTEGGSTSRYNASVELLTRLKKAASFKNQFYYTNYLFELYSNFTFFKNDPLNGDQIRQKENRQVLGYDGSYRNVFYLGKVRSEIRGGIQGRYDILDGIELTRTKDRITNTSRIMYGGIHELNLGTYISEKLCLSDQLDITAALRLDYFNNRYDDHLILKSENSNSTILSPKFNINYKLSDRVQFYLYNGSGFHSNDTRVVVGENGRQTLPKAYGSDLGGVFKLGNQFILQSAIWHLWLDQEFIYVGDEGVVEAGGQTQRFGIDLTARYEMFKNFFVDIDFNLTNPKALGVHDGEDYLPLAPKLTSSGGIAYKQKTGFNGSLRYRYMGNRPANESNSVVAIGYFLVDGLINYNAKNWELGLSVQNIFNTRWKETQFQTESQLKDEVQPISEIHFTPGTPFMAKLSWTVLF